MPFWYTAIRSGTASIVTSSTASRPPKPVRSAAVADVVVGRQAHRLGAVGAGEADLAALRDALQSASTADLLDLDQLGLLLDHRHDVGLAALGRDVVVRPRSARPGALTVSLKVSSAGVVASVTSTLIWLPMGPASSALIR